MRKPRRVARPMTALVLTVSACGGTAGSSAGNNPPRVVFAPAPPLAIGDRIEHREDDPRCTLHHSDGSSIPLDGCPQELAEPGQLRRRADGQCFVDLTMECPPPSVATCNPPPPSPVPCPAGSPETTPQPE